MKADKAKKLQNRFDFEIVLGPETGKKRMVLKAPRWFEHFLSQHKVGEKGTVEIYFDKPTRSEQQLRYYAVLVGLIAKHCGNTWDEIHEALMKLKWGTKQVDLGGEIVEVRRSVSDNARFPKGDMQEQIEFALEKCAFLGINVPSMESLGYISNYKPMKAYAKS